MKIDRCICHDVTFIELRGAARKNKITLLENLQKRQTFGESCQLCHPYVRRMLKDGTVEFSEIIE